MKQDAQPPILRHKDYSEQSVFTPQNMLREARRQKSVPEGAFQMGNVENDFEKGEAQGSLDAIDVIYKAAKTCLLFINENKKLRRENHVR
jgi:hypothetical protein